VESVGQPALKSPGVWGVLRAVLSAYLGYAAVGRYTVRFNNLSSKSIYTGIALDSECADLLVGNNGCRQEIEYLISIRSKVAIENIKNLHGRVLEIAVKLYPAPRLFIPVMRCHKKRSRNHVTSGRYKSELLHFANFAANPISSSVG